MNMIPARGMVSQGQTLTFFLINVISAGSAESCRCWARRVTSITGLSLDIPPLWATAGLGPRVVASAHTPLPLPPTVASVVVGAHEYPNGRDCSADTRDDAVRGTGGTCNDGCSCGRGNHTGIGYLCPNAHHVTNHLILTEFAQRRAQRPCHTCAGRPRGVDGRCGEGGSRLGGVEGAMVTQGVGDVGGNGGRRDHETTSSALMLRMRRGVRRSEQGAAAIPTNPSPASPTKGPHKVATHAKATATPGIPR